MVERGKANSPSGAVDSVLGTLEAIVAPSAWSHESLQEVLRDTAVPSAGLNVADAHGNHPAVGKVVAFFADQDYDPAEAGINTPGQLESYEATAAVMQEIGDMSRTATAQALEAKGIAPHAAATVEEDRSFETVITAPLSKADFLALAAARQATEQIITNGLKARGLNPASSALLNASQEIINGGGMKAA